jgi:hypothetical protein
MVRKSARLIGALALLLSAATASAQVPVAISNLAGLDPAAVRARLAKVPAGWPAPSAFQVATPNGLLTFITAHDLMMDPVLAQLMAAYRTGGDPGLTPQYLECKEFLVRDGATPELSGLTVLMFRNGRFESAFNPVTDSLFLARPDDLPLEDGLGFLSRLPKNSLSPTDRLSVACSTHPAPVRPPRQSGHVQLHASDMGWLAVAPFALLLPSMNRQRVAARQRGTALLASLRVGKMLGANPEKFSVDHTGVRSYRAKSGDYAVLTIDMGGYPSRNLHNFNDATLVGVRSGRVEWVSPPSSFGPGGALLCLDGRGVPDSPRRGCSGTGHFSP